MQAGKCSNTTCPQLISDTNTFVLDGLTGRGAVYTIGGKIELEASIMGSEGAQCGAAALLTRVKNPIKLARKVCCTVPDMFEQHMLRLSGLARSTSWSCGSQLQFPPSFRAQYLKQRARFAIKARERYCPMHLLQR